MWNEARNVIEDEADERAAFAAITALLQERAMATDDARSLYLERINRIQRALDDHLRETGRADEVRGEFH